MDLDIKGTRMKFSHLSKYACLLLNRMSALALQSSPPHHGASFYGPNIHESVANEASDCNEASDMSVNSLIWQALRHSTWHVKNDLNKKEPHNLIQDLKKRTTQNYTNLIKRDAINAKWLNPSHVSFTSSICIWIMRSLSKVEFNELFCRASIVF